MSIEIERKFLVNPDVWKPEGEGVSCRQGYLSSVKQRVVRARVVGSEAFLTVKGIFGERQPPRVRVCDLK